MARSLLKARGMSAKFWGEAVMTTVHLLNHAPTKALSGKTPFKAYNGRKLAVHYLAPSGVTSHLQVCGPRQDGAAAPEEAR
jgi:hypothetical protein